MILKSLILTLLIILTLPIFTGKSITRADHCSANYTHFDIGNRCVREVPPGGCLATEEEADLPGGPYCVLTEGSGDGGDTTAPGDGVIPSPKLPGPEDAKELEGLAGKGFTAENLVGKLVSDIIPIILGIAGFLTVIFIVISGIQFVTSSGNPEAAAAARSRLTFAIIGFIIIILAFAITQLVDTIFLGGSGIL